MTNTDDDLALVVSTTMQFLERDGGVALVRRLAEAGASFERAWWASGAEIGWTSMLVPDHLGGGSASGRPIGDLVTVAQTLGRFVAPGPFLPVNVALAGLTSATTASRHADAISALLEGRLIASWATDEPGRPFGAPPTLTARREGTSWVLDGVKTHVEAAADADVVLTVAMTEDGVRQFLVPADSSGLSTVEVASIDLVRGFGTLRYDGVRADGDAVVGELPETPVLLRRQTLVAQAIQCAEMVGILGRCVDETVDWSRRRFVFGRPLASYQALKHRFADMATHLEVCRAALTAAAAALDADAVDADLLVSAAKAYIGEYSVQIMHDCVQLHGGLGVTWEHDLHVFLRRVELDRSLHGTSEDHQERVFAWHAGELEPAS